MPALARGPVGMAFDGPTVADDADGPGVISGDVLAAGRLIGVLPREISAPGPLEVSTGGRLDGAAPQVEGSGRLCRSLLKDVLPPRPEYEPRTGVTYPRGPAGGAATAAEAVVSGLAECAPVEEDTEGERAGVGRLRPGPLGARKLNGPFGGDFGAAFEAGERS